MKIVWLLVWARICECRMVDSNVVRRIFWFGAAQHLLIIACVLPVVSSKWRSCRCSTSGQAGEFRSPVMMDNDFCGSSGGEGGVSWLFVYACMCSYVIAPALGMLHSYWISRLLFIDVLNGLSCSIMIMVSMWLSKVIIYLIFLKLFCCFRFCWWCLDAFRPQRLPIRHNNQYSFVKIPNKPCSVLMASISRRKQLRRKEKWGKNCVNNENECEYVLK